jgi:SAM-dependent methyltransferase
MARFRLPPQGALRPNGETDPLPFYYKPLVGRLYQARLDVGLGLLTRRFRRLLEVGYGSGLLMPTLAGLSDELYGVDREKAPHDLDAALARLGVKPTRLVQADVQALPFAAGYFDGVVAFSILEHLDGAALPRAAAEVARVLEPGGLFLVGCPAVNKAMNAAFALIGFSGIENHHLSGISDVVAACTPHFLVEQSACLPRALDRAPLGWAPYTAVLFRKRPTPSASPR